MKDNQQNALNNQPLFKTKRFKKKSLPHRIMVGVALSVALINPISSSLAVAADNSNNKPVWQDIDSSITTASRKTSAISVLHKTLKSRQLSLNESLLKGRIFNNGTSVVTADAVARSASDASIINIPLPNGGSVRVQLEKTQLLAPKLAAKFPNIKTWKARGVDDELISGRVDFTNYGFHAMLTMPDGDTVFVERANKNSAAVYNSFSKRDNAAEFSHPFQCKLHADHDALAVISESSITGKSANSRIMARTASKLIHYRLALAATAEYTGYHRGRSNAMSAMATTINRVNQINERDLAITFDLVDGIDRFIYTNPNTDPYTNNDSNKLIVENIDNLRNELNASEYDLGHVFSQGQKSGFALLGSTCQNEITVRNNNGELIPIRGAKGGGVTGSPNPEGDAFDIDFVAHELGHQLGGSHTFNSETGSCGGDNRTPSTAVEPGSGSTIMAYAGICGGNDLQAHSDAAYHIASIEQIFQYTRFDGGTSCGSRTNVSNEEPQPDAGADISIPANTPFVLVGAGSDSDGQTLTYSWEQKDAGAASNVNVDTGDNAIIRSRLPSRSSKRYIPRLQDLFDNKLIPGARLPTSARQMNFSLTVRDNHDGFDWDEMKVNVVGTGRSFRITSHGLRENIEIGTSPKVTWDVAGTNTSPVNCSSVDISLIRSDGSQKMLKRDTNNDGSETVNIPNNALGLNAARFMVICSGGESTFFAVSRRNLNIVREGEGRVFEEASSGGGGGSLPYHLLLGLMLLVLMRWFLRSNVMPKPQKIKLRLNDYRNNSGKNS